jgi:assimilatory nitrate reductase catalytic subunit
VALYVSGQLLTEDYYVANKLMKGYVGSANIDTNSRLCMSSAVAGHKRAFGEDLVPGCYEDFELADLVVLVGSNTAWCHPILFQRIARAKEARPEMKLVVIDPRRTATCDLADLHLPVKPGTDVWLFNGLLSYLARIGALDSGFVARTPPAWTKRWKRRAIAGEPAGVARPAARPAGAAGLLRAVRRHGKTVTAFTMGVNQSSAAPTRSTPSSTATCSPAASAAGHGAVLADRPAERDGRARSRRPGQHAGGAHGARRSDQRDAVQAFWESPRMADKPGLKAVDLFRRSRRARSRRCGSWPPIRWSACRMRTRPGARWKSANWWWPATSCSAPTPTPGRRAAAGAGLGREGRHGHQFRTLHLAPARLPAGAGRSARRTGDHLRSRARMGFPASISRRRTAIFDEHARLSAGATAPAASAARIRHRPAWRADRANTMRWNRCSGRCAAGRLHGSALFGDGRFAHPDGKARFVATRARLPAHAPDAKTIRWC